MDSFNIVNLKVEKANAVLRYRRLRKITTLIELFFLLVMIFRFSFRIPFAFKLSGDYFRGLTVPFFSPRFVFVVGNAIVITLFLKSGLLASQESDGNKSTGADFCAEYVENSVKEYQREENSEMVELGAHVYRKTKSLNRDGGKKPRRQLRRLETAPCRKSPPEVVEEEMSSEEFRRKVENFIAKQQRSLREEEFSAMVGY